MTTRRPGSRSNPDQDSAVHGSAFSALQEPVGPKARSVYVRRRIIVLLGIVALITAVALIIIRPGSDSSSVGEVPKVEVPTDLAEEAETPTGEGGAPACAPAQLEVLAVTDRDTYGPDEFPQVSLTVTNTSSDTCIADLGTAGMTFTVSSGADEVWRSADCQIARDHLAVTLESGETLESEAVSWDRTRSSTETCEIPRDPVGADGASYHLKAGVGGASSNTTAQFLLY